MTGCGYLKEALPFSGVFQQTLDQHQEVGLTFLHSGLLLQHSSDLILVLRSCFKAGTTVHVSLEYIVSAVLPPKK